MSQKKSIEDQIAEIDDLIAAYQKKVTNTASRNFEIGTQKGKITR